MRSRRLDQRSRLPGDGGGVPQGMGADRLPPSSRRPRSTRSANRSRSTTPREASASTRSCPACSTRRWRSTRAPRTSKSRVSKSSRNALRRFRSGRLRARASLVCRVPCFEQNAAAFRKMQEAEERRPTRRRVGASPGRSDENRAPLVNPVSPIGGKAALRQGSHGSSRQAICAKCLRSFSPRGGLSDPTQEIRPRRCARKSGSCSRFWEAGPCKIELWRIALRTS
jgi:hypothetical protein